MAGAPDGPRGTPAGSPPPGGSGGRGLPPQRPAGLRAGTGMEMVWVRVQVRVWAWGGRLAVGPWPQQGPCTTGGGTPPKPATPPGVRKQNRTVAIWTPHPCWALGNRGPGGHVGGVASDKSGNPQQSAQLFRRCTTGTPFRNAVSMKSDKRNAADSRQNSGVRIFRKTKVAGAGAINGSCTYGCGWAKLARFNGRSPLE